MIKSSIYNKKPFKPRTAPLQLVSTSVAPTEDFEDFEDEEFYDDEFFRELDALESAANQNSEEQQTGASENQASEAYQEDALESLRPGAAEINEEMASQWVFPTNRPKRDYQVEIIETALLYNTLVVLPTGLGKTFIASVIMLNFYRWFPTGKLIFMAPTRPLVDQQIHACYEIMGVKESDTVEMIGNQIKKEKRAEHWKEKRVFFATPQIVHNDLKSGICPADQIVLVIVDEAHRAQKKYSYCSVIEEISKVHDCFRVVGLTATPATTLPNVQKVVDNLHINTIEVKDDDDPDVSKYTHKKEVQVVSVNLTRTLETFLETLYELIKVPLRRAYQHKAIFVNDPSKISKSMALAAMNKNLLSGNRSASGWMISNDLVALLTLAHAKENLLINGIRSLYNFLNEKKSTTEQKSRHAMKEVFAQPQFVDLMKKLESTIAAGVPSHPKLEKLEEIILEHFQKSEAAQTRVIIFAQYRDCVEEINDVLSKHSPTIRVMPFVGQSSKKTSSGLTQKEQKQVLKKFREGGYNCIVSTSVGEEGIDIGDIDLIVCYDSLSSPIRMVQRMGRTGRKRDGKAIVLVSKGYEENTFNSSQKKKGDIYAALRNAIKPNSKSALQFYWKNPRMIPEEITPVMKDLHIITSPLRNNFGREKKRKEANSNTLELAYVEKHYGLPTPNDANAAILTEDPSSGILHEESCKYMLYASPVNMIGHSAVTDLLISHTTIFHNAQYFDESFTADKLLIPVSKTQSFATQQEPEPAHVIPVDDDNPAEISNITESTMLDQQGYEDDSFILGGPTIHDSFDDGHVEDTHVRQIDPPSPTEPVSERSIPVRSPSPAQAALPPVSAPVTVIEDDEDEQMEEPAEEEPQMVVQSPKQPEKVITQQTPSPPLFSRKQIRLSISQREAKSEAKPRKVCFEYEKELKLKKRTLVAGCPLPPMEFLKQIPNIPSNLESTAIVFQLQQAFNTPMWSIQQMEDSERNRFTLSAALSRATLTYSDRRPRSPPEEDQDEDEEAPKKRTRF